MLRESPREQLRPSKGGGACMCAVVSYHHQVSSFAGIASSNLSRQVLTLASNERIPLRAHMRMIFEIRDLKYATPATVSRAGILYISTVEGQQWHSLIASWVTASGYGETVKSQLSDLFDSYIPRAVQMLITQMKTSVECEPTTAVSALSLIHI